MFGWRRSLIPLLHHEALTKDSETRHCVAARQDSSEKKMSTARAFYCGVKFSLEYVCLRIFGNGSQRVINTDGLAHTISERATRFSTDTRQPCLFLAQRLTKTRSSILMLKLYSFQQYPNRGCYQAILPSLGHVYNTD